MRSPASPGLQARPQPGLTADQPPGLCTLDAGTGFPLTLKEEASLGIKRSVPRHAGPR
jgi:hypothetical protein